MRFNLRKLPRTAYVVQVNSEMSFKHALDNYITNSKYVEDVMFELNVIHQVNSNERYFHMKNIEPDYFDPDFAETLNGNLTKIKKIQSDLKYGIRKYADMLLKEPEEEYLRSYRDLKKYYWSIASFPNELPSTEIAFNDKISELQKSLMEFCQYLSPVVDILKEYSPLLSQLREIGIIYQINPKLELGFNSILQNTKDLLELLSFSTVVNKNKIEYFRNKYYTDIIFNAMEVGLIDFRRPKRLKSTHDENIKTAIWVITFIFVIICVEISFSIF